MTIMEIKRWTRMSSPVLATILVSACATEEDTTPHDGQDARVPGACVPVPPECDTFVVCGGPFPEIDCGAHGTCVLDPPCAIWSDEVKPLCVCDPGYAGDTCKDCEEGWVAANQECTTTCANAGLECWVGSCNHDPVTPGCDCWLGYTGTRCDACSDGYEMVWDCDDCEIGTCTPVCDACADGEICVADAAGPQCRCADAYVTGEEGGCAWPGLVEDPAFDLDCAFWQVWNAAANDTGSHAYVSVGQLEIGIENRCSLALGSAQARYPGPPLVDSPAVRFEARGTVGSVLEVHMGPTLLRDPNLLTSLADAVAKGTGRWESVDVCIDPNRMGTVGRLTFAVQAPGVCAERVDYAFSIRHVEVVSLPECG